MSLENEQDSTAYDRNYILDNRLTLQWYPERVVAMAQMGSMLELGLGHGYSTEYFAKAFQRYQVVEGSQEMIDRFRKRFAIEGVDIAQGYFEDFETDADPCFGTGLAPSGFRGLDRDHEPFDVRLRICHAEPHSVWRALVAHLAERCGLRQRKALIEKRVEFLLSRFRRAFAVHLGTRGFGKRCPISAARDRLDSAIEGGAVALEEWVRHG